MKWWGKLKPESSCLKQILCTHDIILTTYDEVVRSYPFAPPPKAFRSEEEQDAWYDTEFSKKLGILHQIKFHRVVLDEAQTIRNGTTKTSIACRALTSTVRWTLTGTPVFNSLDEFWPYLDFLKITGCKTLEGFQARYANSKRPDQSKDRLFDLLDKIMIRRTHKDKIFNRPLIKLPEIKQETRELNFNLVEKRMYDLLEECFVQRCNQICKLGSSQQGARSIFVMLLRLRQFVSHSLLARISMVELFSYDDIEWLVEELTPEFDVHDPILDQLSVLIKDHRKWQERVILTAADLNLPDDENWDMFAEKVGPREAFEIDALRDAVSCCQCGEIPESWRLCMTRCGHVYCSPCFNKVKAKAENEETSMLAAKCHTCKRKFYFYQVVEGLEAVRHLSKKVLGKPVDPMPWLHAEDPPPRTELLQSTKMSAAQQQIDAWLKRDKDVKIIVFCEFIGCLEILQNLCEGSGWGCCIVSLNQVWLILKFSNDEPVRRPFGAKNAIHYY